MTTQDAVGALMENANELERAAAGLRQALLETTIETRPSIAAALVTIQQSQLGSARVLIQVVGLRNLQPRRDPELRKPDEPECGRATSGGCDGEVSTKACRVGCGWSTSRCVGHGGAGRNATSEAVHYRSAHSRKPRRQRIRTKVAPRQPKDGTALLNEVESRIGALAKRVANRTGRTSDVEDLISVGREAAASCIGRYDDRQGGFWRFANKRVSGAMTDWLRQYSGAVRFPSKTFTSPISLDAPISPSSRDTRGAQLVDDRAPSVDDRIALTQLLNADAGLTLREKAVVRREAAGKDESQIGREMKLPLHAVRATRESAVAKLRGWERRAA